MPQVAEAGVEDADTQAAAPALHTPLGRPLLSFGAPSTNYLTQAGLRRAAFEFRYAGYVAKPSATNLGSERGYLLRQQYQWLPPDA